MAWDKGGRSRVYSSHQKWKFEDRFHLLLCPVQTIVDQWAVEGMTQGVHLAGDVMYDAVLHTSVLAKTHSDVSARLELTHKEYLLATIHRPQNTDDPGAVSSILTAFNQMGEKVVFPAQPRTQTALARYDLEPPGNVLLIDAVGYPDMLVLEKYARLILTDSGGIQKEAFFFSMPCVTLREETEWVETVSAG